MTTVRRFALVGFVWFGLAGAERAYAQSCNRQCPAGQPRDVKGCCIGEVKPATGAKPVTKPKVNPRGCAAGMERSEDTGGKCCWPGQVWTDRCVGTPTTCPDGHRATADGCELQSCPTGRVRMKDGVNCCWEGQGWSQARKQCVGAPTSCPGDLIVVGEDCRIDEARIRREKEAAERAIAACESSCMSEKNSRANNTERTCLNEVYVDGNECESALNRCESDCSDRNLARSFRGQGVERGCYDRCNATSKSCYQRRKDRCEPSRSGFERECRRACEK